VHGADGRHYRSGGLVALMLDRDVGGTGVPMEFCGAESRIPLGAVELAMRTQDLGTGTRTVAAIVAADERLRARSGAL